MRGSIGSRVGDEPASRFRSSSSAAPCLSIRNEKAGIRRTCGFRSAGTFGQNAPKTPEILETTVKDSSLTSGDLNAVLRLIGGGANGFYPTGEIGVRALRQEFQTSAITTTQTNTNLSYNGGLGISAGWFFVEANPVYFGVIRQTTAGHRRRKWRQRLRLAAWG